ncbi:MAG: acetyl xylan esterase [Planctomycetaceae bacterium]|nr:acetyl xylan esterase [Planctomycetaceae bacterium]
MVVIVLAALGPASYIKGAEQGKHLFILSGQSNMARLELNESFTPTVIKEFGKDNVIVVKDAKGGQPIRRWYKKWKPAIAASDAAGQPSISDIRRTRSRTPDSVEKTSRASKRAQRRSKNRRPVSRANGDLYNRLMKEVNTAIEGTKIGTVTFVWMQGEADSKEHGQVYAASLKGLKSQLSEDLGRTDVNFVIGRLSDYCLDNTRFSHWTMVRKAQVELRMPTHVQYGWIQTTSTQDWA